MKKILVICVLVFSCFTAAQSLMPWICQSDFDDYKNDVVGPKQYYPTKYECELSNGEECFDTTGKEDYRRFKTELGAIVDDTVGDTQANTEDAAAATEVTDRETKRVTREASLQSCLVSVPNATVVDDLKNCLVDTIKQLEEQRTLEADL